MGLLPKNRRLYFFASLLEEGYTPLQSARVSIALMPMDDGEPPSRLFYKQVRALSRSFAKETRKASPAEKCEAATTMLLKAKELAESLGEPYYSTRYDAVLNFTEEEAQALLSDD